MQQAIPFKSWPLPCATNGASHLNNLVLNRAGRGGGDSNRDMLNMVSENAVIVVSRKGCCMSHVVRRLLLALGVNPAIYEIDEADEVGVLNELGMICKDDNNKDKKLLLPAVFIGGRLFGGLDKVMATHISGELVPVLKDAGALWL